MSERGTDRCGLHLPSRREAGLCLLVCAATVSRIRVPWRRARRCEPAGPPVCVKVQSAAVQPNAGCKGLLGHLGVVEPEGMSKDIVEGGFHLGQQRGHFAARKRRVKEGQAITRRATFVPDVGIMRVAMGDNAASVCCVRRCISVVGEIECFLQRAGVGQPLMTTGASAISSHCRETPFGKSKRLLW